MKKQFWGIALVLALALLCAGCQKETKLNESEAPTKSSTIETESDLPPSDNSEIIGDPGIKTDGAIDSYLTSFEANLEDGGLTLNDKAVKDAASIGALEGYGFNINGKPIEIYLFDSGSTDSKSIENLKSAKELGFITIFGVEINGETPKANCTINDNIVLIFPFEDMFGVHPDKEGIIQAFIKISQ